MVRLALSLCLAALGAAGCNDHRYGYFGDGEGEGGDTTTTGDRPEPTTVTPDPSRPDPTVPDPTVPDPTFPDPTFPEPTTITSATVTSDTDTEDPTGVPGICGEQALISAVPVQGFGDNFAGNDLFFLGCNPNPASESVFVWTAPFDGLFEFHTVGSSFDTVLSVQDGFCGGPELGCNDDTIGAFSSVTTKLAVGQTVTAVVEGLGGQLGEVVLNVENLGEPPPPSCEVQAVINDLTGDFASSTFGLPSQWSSDFCGGADAQEFVFLWTPPFTGTFRVEIVAASFDTVLYVRQFDCFGAELGCNNPGGGTNPAFDVFLFAEDGSVMIFVDGAIPGTAGEFTLRITAL